MRGLSMDSPYFHRRACRLPVRTSSPPAQSTLLPVPCCRNRILLLFATTLAVVEYTDFIAVSSSVLKSLADLYRQPWKLGPEAAWVAPGLGKFARP